MVVQRLSLAEQIENCARLIASVEMRRDDESVSIRRDVTWTLGRIQPGEYDAARARLLLEIVKQINRIGEQLLRGVEPAAYAVYSARQSGQDSLLREALTSQGCVLISLDNIHDASVCLEEAWKIAERYPEDHVANFAVLANIGAALYQAFMYQDAMEAYHRAEAVATSAGNDLWRGQVLVNVALCALETRKFEEGLLVIRQAINLMGEPKSPDECIARVFAESNYVRLLLQEKKIEEAKERVVFAKKYAAQSGSVRAELAVAGAEGLAAIYGGSRDIGRERVLSALERARAVPASMRLALLTTVAALEETGEPAEALGYHREFSLMVKRQLRANILQYTKQQVIALSEETPQAAARISDEQGDALRQAYLHSGVGTVNGSDAFLLSQALTAEAEWDSDGVHIYRVGALSKRLAEVLGFDETTCGHVELAARLHDLGMKTVPRMLKLRHGSLLPEEKIEVEKHCIDGAELVAHSNVDYGSLAEDVIRHHHERWDGTGYPDGLRGSGIPIAARIVCLSDSFDSMIHARIYKEALTVDAALAEIERELGSQFDPHAGRIFIKMVKELHDANPDLDSLLGAAAQQTSLSRTRAKLRLPRQTSLKKPF